ncbi:MAG: LysM peptidoglycan-binding domain-containing protein [Anaerolineales bacterium]
MATGLPPALPFLTSTPSITPTAIPLTTGIIQPTPTPFTYIVVPGDTLIGIASRYGISPDALMAANPGIQAAVLPVGTTLIIPTANTTTVQPLPTPVPLPVQQARCWMEPDGGLWCFALVPNQYTDTLENLSAQFTLLDAGGHALASGTAFGLLDILPAGLSMPLAFHFPPSENTGGSIQVQVLTATRLLPGDVRYLPVNVENTLVTLDSFGRTAQVTGQVLFSGSGTAKTTWVLGIAFDADGTVVGLRRWESKLVLSANSPISFDFLVSSVGPAIDRVDFLVEARP